jgi:isoleucyl-tRNA synthetase
MNDSTSDKAPVRDYRDTLFLPKTDFPMRAGLPQREPEILKRWQDMDLYAAPAPPAAALPASSSTTARPTPTATCISATAINKILKDIVSRSQAMMGKDANYVPGWDCHGLPIEWKVEEQYRAKGLDKDEVPINEFRRECREFAAHWIDVQREEFERLGVLGDWKNPYTTMNFAAEAQIARELMKFAMSGQLYRGSKPVMWSVVEKTALAEAEVEYHDYTSDTVWVKFPVADGANRRASKARDHHLDDDAVDHPRQPGDQLFAEDRLWPLSGRRGAGGQLGEDRRSLCDRRRARRRGDEGGARRGVFAAARRVRPMCCRAPCAAPAARAGLRLRRAAARRRPRHRRGRHRLCPHRARPWPRRTSTSGPRTRRTEGRHRHRHPVHRRCRRRFTADAPGFEGKRVITDKGEKGDANEAVIRPWWRPAT